MADTNLNKAIADAAAQITSEGKENNDTQVGDPKDPDTNDDNSDDNDPDADPDKSDDPDADDNQEDLDEAQQTEAKNLYKLLKDPNTNVAVIKVLAEQAGLFAQRGDTKQQIEEKEEKLLDIIEEALGPEYKFLGTKLEKIFSKVISKNQEVTRSEVARIEQTQLTNEVDAVLDKLSRETKGESRKLENRMIELMDKVYPNPNLPVEDYLRMIHKLANEGKAPNSQKVADKIRKNANNIPERVRSAGSHNEPVVPTKKMNINESINWALGEMNKKR